ncbi:MAG: hypothetical protein IPH05_09130 [Flavobacteriales bacterium]|nr:hypothetical protein [Flavobacteriales bacterium]MBK6552048.1 hypothetical protein [Flavobacteriales bacterium]MBK6883087.1 hypothetical protein [Flavobacteriales bacterium]MBK7620286.1 hypothetical protein [Flavobacteriales bacterium]MBK8530400.1 hypothetical protein [Flavobacteriales bacterium]
MPTTFSYLSSALLVCTIVPFAAAQLPDHRYEFIPLEETTEYKTLHLEWSEDAANDRYMVHMEKPVTGKGSDQFHLYLYSRETGTMVSKLNFGEDWAKGRGFDDILFLNDRLYVTSEDVNYKTGKVDFVAQEFALPELALKGEPITFATINFNPKGLTWDRRRSETFLESPDGEHIVFYYDRIKTQENEQLVLLFMMDGNMQPVSQNAYRIPYESDKIVTAGVEVNNNGIVYALMTSKFKNRPITNKEINYSYELVGMSGETMVSKPIEFPEGYTALKANLVLNGDAPRVGGFFVEPDQSIKETAGHFILDLDEQLAGVGELVTHRYPSPLDYQLMRTDLLQRADGGCYLIGGSWEVSATAIQEKLLVVNSISADGTNEWTTRIPRRLKTNDIYEDHGYMTMLTKDKLMVLMPDDEDNLPRYRSGEEPKLMTATKRVLITVGFSDTGKAEFASFEDKGPFKAYSGNFLTTANVNRDSQVCLARKTDGKKSELWGFLYLNFKD